MIAACQVETSCSLKTNTNTYDDYDAEGVDPDPCYGTYISRQMPTAIVLVSTSV